MRIFIFLLVSVKAWLKTTELIFKNNFGKDLELAKVTHKFQVI